MKKIILILVLLPMIMKSQNVMEQVVKCPVLFGNGKLTYYMPQQAGSFFQMPPDRKPYYVNIVHVPWLKPLEHSVKETQSTILIELANQISHQNQKTIDTSLFLRQMAWCILLQYSISKEIDTGLTSYIQLISTDTDANFSAQAKLVLKLLDDYKSVMK